MVDRLIQRTGTLLRRRGRLMAAAAGVVLGGGVLLLGSLPTSYTARALVGPPVGTYDGPIERLIEQTLSPASLAGVASACEVLPHRGPGEVLVGAPADPLMRLAARVEARGRPVQGVVVEAAGASPDQAIAAAGLLAARLVACDADLRALLPTGDAPASTAAATQDGPEPLPARLLLEQLRLRHPLLRDAEAERRLAQLAARLSEDRIAHASLGAKLEGHAAEADRLEALVREEAGRAWRLDRAERLAQRAPRPAAPSAAQGEPPPEAPRPAPPSRVAELEAELQRLLVSRTTLHPDVRRLQRLLEAERLRVAAAPAPPDARQAETRDTGDARHASAPARPLALDDAPHPLIAVADGPPDVVGPVVDGPEVWTQRAPSYPAWAEARARAEEVRLALDALEQEQAARRREHDLLTGALAQLAAPRLEEARLIARLEQEARRAAPAATAGPEAVGSIAAPLRLLEPPAVHAERSPWAHLPALLLLSLLLPAAAGVLLEARDRSVGGPDDLEGLGAPLLGVIPHLRARGR